MARHPALTAELQLAAACCIWPPSESRAMQVRKCAAGNIDWRQFLRIVERHRIFGHVHDALGDSGLAVPADVAGRLHERALESARQSMRFAAESLRLKKLFDESAIQIIFLKGVSLARLAYDSLGVKHSWDIDVLIPPQAVPRAVELLNQAGYLSFPPLPPLSDRRYRRWLRYGREYIFVHQAQGLYVELHWKLVDNACLLRGISAASPTQSVCVSGDLELETLRDQDLFAYLCVHGAMHGWSRFKWLADVAALIADDDAPALAERLAYARRLNAELSVVQALLLCDVLFGSPAMGVLARNLRRSWRNRHLERAALKVILRGDGAEEPDKKPFGMLSIYATHFLLGRGVHYLAQETWNKLNAPYDLLFASLPPWLGFLYAPLRVVSWIGRRGRIRQLPVTAATSALGNDPAVGEG